MARYARSEPFFPIMTMIVVGFILLGFGAAIFGRGDGYMPPAALQVHGAVTLSWFALTLVQALLVRKANFALHKTLGSLSVLLVIGIVVLGYVTTAGAMANPAWTIGGFDNVGSTVFPFFDIITFVILFALGLSHRANAAAHKRLMVLAGVIMMDPAVARAAYFLFGAPQAALLLEASILLAFPLYDWRTRGKLHWASVFAVVLYTVCFALRLALGGTEGWAEFARAVF